MSKREIICCGEISIFQQVLPDDENEQLRSRIAELEAAARSVVEDGRSVPRSGVLVVDWTAMQNLKNALAASEESDE